MLFSQDRNTLRKMYADAWQKHRNGDPLTPLEDQIASVIALHPEYHAEITASDLGKDYLPEGGGRNPFLHLGLHLGVREQVATDRPPGVAGIFSARAATLGDRHEAEHRMMECLAETLWEAQRENRPPDEAQYMERLRRASA